MSDGSPREKPWQERHGNGKCSQGNEMPVGVISLQRKQGKPLLDMTYHYPYHYMEPKDVWWAASARGERWAVAVEVLASSPRGRSHHDDSPVASHHLRALLSSPRPLSKREEAKMIIPRGTQRQFPLWATRPLTPGPEKRLRSKNAYVLHSSFVCLWVFCGRRAT